MLDIIPCSYPHSSTPDNALPPTSDRKLVRFKNVEKIEKHQYHMRTYTKTEEDLQKTDSTIEHINNINESSQKLSTYTPTGKTDNLSDRRNKQTPQPDKTVTHEPTVTAADEKTNSTNDQKKTNRPDRSTTDRKRIYNNPVSVNDDIPTLENTQKINKAKLTMSTPDPPSGSGTSRRRVQRYKRGGQQPKLGSHAKTTISQLLHRKGQTRAPPDTYDSSITIGSFHSAPLSARMHSPHVYPSAGNRGELDNDCIYLHHPSRRLDLQSPLALTPLTQHHSPELIDKPIPHRNILNGLIDNQRLLDLHLHS